MYEIIASAISTLSLAANGAIWHRMGKVEEKIEEVTDKVNQITFIGVKGSGKRERKDSGHEN